MAAHTLHRHPQAARQDDWPVGCIPSEAPALSLAVSLSQQQRSDPDDSPPLSCADRPALACAAVGLLLLARPLLSAAVLLQFLLQAML